MNYRSDASSLCSCRAFGGGDSKFFAKVKSPNTYKPPKKLSERAGFQASP